MKSELLQSRMKRLFTEGFTAMDIAESLLSFDADKSPEYILQFMSDNNLDVKDIKDAYV
ncbi:MAG: endolytic transglycosylase MltG [Planctomycetes bacterium]|nr:endolytic transglycosylase MltG [Planctomycetota bacterium]